MDCRLGAYVKGAVELGEVLVSVGDDTRYRGGESAAGEGGSRRQPERARHQRSCPGSGRGSMDLWYPSERRTKQERGGEYSFPGPSGCSS